MILLEGLGHVCVPESGGGILAQWDVSRDVSWDASWDVEMKERNLRDEKKAGVG